MSQPLSTPRFKDQECDSSGCETPPIMFSMKKDPNSHTLNVHQFPLAMPRFQTQPLESAGFQEVPELQSHVSSIARSAVFPLPDVSDRIFNVGIATFRCPSVTALNKKELKQTGYKMPPADVTYALTMTSMGDIYCHSLLECNALEETQAQQCNGLPIGTMTVPIPRVDPDIADETNIDSTEMHIKLRNVFPVPSSAITPYTVNNEADCCRFQTLHPDVKAENAYHLPQEEDDGTSVNDQSVRNLPHSLHSMTKSQISFNKEEANEYCINTFRVACTKEHSQNQTDLSILDDIPDTSINKDKIDQWSNIYHSTPRFHVTTDTSTEKKQNCQISLPSHHVVIAVRDRVERADDDSSVEHKFKQTGTEDMTVDLVHRLKVGFFSNEFHENNRGETKVKSEWSVSSNGSNSIIESDGLSN